MLTFHSQAQQQEQWQIIPSTCIVDKSGDFCRLRLSVQPPKTWLSESPKGEVCFDLQQQRLTCMPQLTRAMEVNVQFNEPSLFGVIVANKLVYAQRLDIQTLSPTKQRRRVRSPWSIF